MSVTEQTEPVRQRTLFIVHFLKRWKIINIIIACEIIKCIITFNLFIYHKISRVCKIIHFGSLNRCNLLLSIRTLITITIWNLAVLLNTNCIKGFQRFVGAGPRTEQQKSRKSFLKCLAQDKLL